ncbi:MAG TPA: type IV secretion system protein TraC [Alphaproteobacteria bacterium]|nr:type IV secretion system protein TraC [Alphaproteobacteria bacterium]
MSDLNFNDTFKRAYDFKKLSSFLPYEAFDDAQELFFNESSKGFVIESFPLVGCTNDMQSEISGFFKYTLPEGSSFQCLLYGDPNTAPFLHEWKTSRETSCEVLNSLTKRRYDYFLRLEKDKDIHPRNFRCIFSVTLDSEVPDSEICALKDSFEVILSGFGLPFKVWNASDLLTFLREFLSFSTKRSLESVPHNPFDLIKDQVSTLGQKLDIREDKLLLNPQKISLKTFTATKTPPFWSLYSMTDLLGDMLRPASNIPCGFYLHYVISVESQEQAKNKFEVNSAWVNRQVQFGKMRQMLPHLCKQAEELDFVRGQLDEGERLLKTSWTAGLFEEEEKLDKSTSHLLNLFRSQKWELTPNTYLHFPSFLSVLPCMWDKDLLNDHGFLNNLKTTITSEASNVLPLQGEWKGNGSDGMLLVGRKGQVFSFNPFNTGAGNYNISVVGKSGSGKSVFMQDLMTSLRASDTRIFVIDVGRSFEKTCKRLNGRHVEFSTKSTLSLNPFTGLKNLEGLFLEDGQEVIVDGLSMLKPILSLMVAPTQGTTDIENALLEKALMDVWVTHKERTSLTVLSTYLLNQENPLSKKLGEMLYPYTEQGFNGKFFKGEASLSFKEDLIVFELEELKEKKDLQAVVVQMLILQITSQMFCGDRSQKFAIILDEAWDLLRGGQGGTFIETLARRVRKYKGSLIVGTQGIDDFFNNPAARAAFDNSDWTCMLAQKANSIASLKETNRIVMDEAMEEILKSVKTVSGKYSEVMVYGPHGYGVGRLCLDPFSRILYTTKAEEFAAVEKLLRSGLSMEQAVLRVAKQTFPDEFLGEFFGEFEDDFENIFKQEEEKAHAA